MNNLWRRIGNRKSSSKSASALNSMQNEPQEPEPTRPKLVLLGNPAKRFDWVDLERASMEILGKGTTYRVDLADGTAKVVLKKLNHVVLSAEGFRDKVEAVGAMDHENLLPLRGYIYSKEKKFLLYDYMPQGSLSDLLRVTRGYNPLRWELRLSIALGAARAIEHLHAQDIHHGRIKSSNVLLTPSFEGRVSDYGLVDLTRSALVGGADPTMADVYNYGVLLLELLNP